MSKSFLVWTQITQRILLRPPLPTQGRIQEIQKQGAVAVAARAQPRTIGATP